MTLTLHETQQMFKVKQDEEYQELTKELRQSIGNLGITDLMNQLQLASYDPAKLRKLRPYKIQLEAILYHTII